jgi:DNA topoisomerase-3
MRMADAVEARISLDLRIGAAFTRLITLTLQQRIPDVAEKVLSYGMSTRVVELTLGPCQFPTLGFVVDQYKRVQAFVPEPFWYIAVSIERESEEEGGEPTQVSFTWRRNHLFDLPIAMLLYEQCVENPIATVLKVETKPTSKWKPLPLTTVELQQSGSRLLGMTPKRVLEVSSRDILR